MKYFVNSYSAKYALVDSFTRALWFVLDDENVAHLLKDTFSGKVNLLVFDISTFENCNLDNHVCTNWEIPEISNFLIVRPGPSATVKEKTYTASDTISAKLINKANWALPLSIRDDLIQQLMLAYSVFRCTTQVPESIKKIFATELNSTDVERKLYDLASNNVSSASCIMAKTLKVLDRLYD